MVCLIYQRAVTAALSCAGGKPAATAESTRMPVSSCTSFIRPHSHAIHAAITCLRGTCSRGLKRGFSIYNLCSSRVHDRTCAHAMTTELAHHLAWMKSRPVSPSRHTAGLRARDFPPVSGKCVQQAKEHCIS
mmetsp:Transcript_26969/g.81645  ORF Transcript_26969/g.81645 Transcript_26969/m.81645 type:complete len:132 (+) Transcript_26969:101-496(+)